MSSISAIDKLPEISFIDSKTVENVQDELISDYETAYKAATGTAITLADASPMRLSLYAAAAQIYQAMQYVDRAGKQSFLKYSYGNFLDNLAALKGLTRAAATAATTTLRFTLSAAQASATPIPSGTRATNGAATVYFATTAYAEIAAGATSVDVAAACTTTGTTGNEFAVGAISTVVDPIAYVASIANTTVSAGGSDQETDNDLAERTYLAPGAYSTAGPEDGYTYCVKSYNSNIGDVKVSGNTTAGTVDILFLMDDGSTPPAEVISGVQTFLDEGSVRPMTDLVTVAAPIDVTYNISLSYFINQSDSAQAVSIQSAVATAVAEYVAWQRHIGRDINPSKLIALIMAAGAKRVTITSPTYTTVAATSVAALSGTATVTYSGLEDD